MVFQYEDIMFQCPAPRSPKTELVTIYQATEKGHAFVTIRVSAVLEFADEWRARREQIRSTIKQGIQEGLEDEIEKARGK